MCEGYSSHYSVCLSSDMQPRFLHTIAPHLDKVERQSNHTIEKGLGNYDVKGETHN